MTTTNISVLQGANSLGNATLPTVPAAAGFSFAYSGTDGTSSVSGASLSNLVSNWKNYIANTTFTVNATPNTQTGTVSYAYISGTPGVDNATGLPSATPTTAGKAAVLPANSTLSGLTNAPMSVTLASIPAGYSLDHVVAPDGQSYASVAAAQAVTSTTNNSCYNTTSNNWKVYLKANLQSPTLTAQFSATSAGVTAPASLTVNFQNADGSQWTGLTGSVIPSAVITATSTALNAKLTGTTYQSWFLTNYVDPMGNAGDTVLADSVNGVPAGLVQATSNAYVAQYNYVGTVLVSAPATINFGTHNVTGSTQTLTGALSTPVTVNDTRAGTGITWSLSVSETKALTDTNGSSLNLEGDIYFNGNEMTQGTSIAVGSGTNNGLTTLLATSSSAFTLKVPAAMQSTKANEQGSVTWTLTSAM
jgi:hypothetical protein